MKAVVIVENISVHAVLVSVASALEMHMDYALIQIHILRYYRAVWNADAV